MKKMATFDTTLNNFPDEILIHILSFLPFKQAFRTCLTLSKRWLPLPYSLSVHFKNITIQTESWIHFHQMLDAVILSPRSQQYTLRTFHINDCQFEVYQFESESANSTINQWLEAAKRRGIVDLSIFLILYTSVNLSPIIFSCKTLVVLKLRLLKVSSMFHCSVDLPLLKTLSLIDVRLHDIEDLKKIIFGCPVLDDLKTSCVTETDTTNDVGSTAGWFSKPLSKLIKANIRLFEVPLRAVSNVQSLTVTEMGKILPNEEINSYYKGYPMFENLIELRLFWFFDGTRDLIWDDVVKMLQNSPKLQALSITKWSTPSRRGRDDWKYPYHVPKCVSSRLTTCQILGYHAVEADFRFATYILQNAKLLQVMRINYRSYSESRERSKFLDDLPSCPRISPTCKLSVI